MTQQGDVLLYQRNDGGDITVEAGLVEMSGGLETAVYLSLFGGNEDDDGSSDNALQWWGNYGEEPTRQQRSETGYLLQSIAAIPANLRRVEAAMSRDLEWLTSVGAAESVQATADLTALNEITMRVVINGNTALEYVENWKADL